MSLVFITGGGRRIGRWLAYQFADKGWDVAINYNSSHNEAMETLNNLKSKDVKCAAYQADVSNKKQIRNALDKCIEGLGTPDVLINNAGIFPEARNIQDIEEELIDKTFAVNLKGEFFSSQYYSEKVDNGKIINIGSLGAVEVWKGRLPYHISKAGVEKLTKVLANELAPKISVNCVAPGTIVVPNEPAADSSLISTKKIPMQRYGTVEDIFEAVYFFATTTNYITGQTICVDGGYHNAR